MTRVATSLWFDGGIEEAAALSVSLMPGSEILHTSRHPDDAAFPGGKGGPALTVDTQALMTMAKIDVGELERASAGS